MSTILYLRSAEATANTFTIKSGANLIVSDDPSLATHAVNKRFLDAAIQSLGASGTADLDAERAARGAADDALSDRIDQEVIDRAADVQAEETARLAAAATEKTAREAAESALSVRIDQEVSDRAAAVDAEEDARIAGDVALQAQISDVHIAQYAYPIYTDGCRPLPMPISLFGAGHQGWYFTNNATQNKINADGSTGSAVNKINWYMVNNGAPTPACKFEAKVSSIKEINVPVTLISQTSTPFITIYTKMKGDGLDYKSSPTAIPWYRAKKTWTRDGDLAGGPSLVDGGNYLFRVKVGTSALTASYPDYANIDLKATAVQSATAGPWSEEDDIFLIAFSTDSGSSQGNVNFVAKHFEMRTSRGNKKILFSNDTVLMYRLLEKLEVVNQELYKGPVL